MSTAIDGLKLVPFNASWITHDKLDVKAIYRRPVYREDEYGEFIREFDADGLPRWDLTGPLPVKAHNKWLAKGFEYITLADIDSLVSAARANTVGGEWKQYNQHAQGGPWNYRLYVRGQSMENTAEAQQLAADVEKYGSDTVEAIRRQADKAFALPGHLQNIPPGGKVKPKGVTMTTKATA